MRAANDGRVPARSGVVLEAVVAGEVWPPDHRRLVRAAVPIWVADGVSLDLGRLLADQPEPLEVVPVGDDMVFFPGPADHDAVDTAVAAWAAYRDHVVAVTRCWAQHREGDESRLRVYAVVVDDAAAAPPSEGRVRRGRPAGRRRPGRHRGGGGHPRSRRAPPPPPRRLRRGLGGAGVSVLPL